MNIIIKTAAFAASLCCASAAANAAVIFNIQEVGQNVQVAFSGSIDTSGLKIWKYGEDDFAQLNSSSGTIGQVNGDMDRYSIKFDPVSFGTGGVNFSDSVSGDSFLVTDINDVARPYLALARGYTSGDHMSGQSIYSGASFASLGLVSGTSVFTTLGNGDTITVNVRDIPAVPLPAGGLLLLSGLGGIAALRRRRKA
ncbi:VPLPA-CTERM sorting domain-containing protein [Celeribacter arenosi]|uniref:VPLPA-CTERM protein sorting domain-containing protein n=1 Tax=Celeribacter arenosi TaxID=792649 RepID=A0ABP7JW30_9RHOB